MPISTLPKFLLAACCLVPAVPMLAGTVPYPNPGTIAPSTATYASGSNGIGVNLFYYGSSASFNDTIQVYDVTDGYTSGDLLPNHDSKTGEEVTVGANGLIKQGDQLVFVIDAPGGVKYASEAAYSADDLNHVYITSYAGGTVDGAALPAGLFLGFEDQPKGASDWDYNDLEVVTTGVSTSVTPEPSTLALFGTGLIGLAGAAKRRFV